MKFDREPAIFRNAEIKAWLAKLNIRVQFSIPHQGVAGAEKMIRDGCDILDSMIAHMKCDTRHRVLVGKNVLAVQAINRAKLQGRTPYPRGPSQYFVECAPLLGHLGRCVLPRKQRDAMLEFGGKGYGRSTACVLIAADYTTSGGVVVELPSDRRTEGGVVLTSVVTTVLFSSTRWSDQFAYGFCRQGCHLFRMERGQHFLDNGDQSLPVDEVEA